MLNEGCLVSRNIYPLDCTVGTRESYVTNRASIPSLSVHISYAYELLCRSIIIPYRESLQTEKMLSIFRFGTYALSLAHLREVMAALSFAFLLRSRRLCTRHPFLFNCEHRFSLVQLYYNNRKSPCQHPENRITSRVSPKNCPMLPYGFFSYFPYFLVANILRKIFSKIF